LLLFILTIITFLVSSGKDEAMNFRKVLSKKVMKEIVGGSPMSSSGHS